MHFCRRRRVCDFAIKSVFAGAAKEMEKTQGLAPLKLLMHAACK
jgi:hypothetical protein